MAFPDTEDWSPKELDLQPLQKMRKAVIFVIGGPGSGKATQCKRLAAEFSLHHISMGQAIKDRFKKTQTPNSKALQDVHDTGGMISLEEAMHILTKEMLRLLEKEPKPFIVHGFPRHLIQAVEYERKIGFPQTVILLDASTNVMRDRLKERATVSRRIDDNAVQVEERLTHYQTTCQAVIDYYRPHKKLHFVEANNNTDQVYKDMAQVIELWT